MIRVLRLPDLVGVAMFLRRDGPDGADARTPGRASSRRPGTCRRGAASGRRSGCPGSASGSRRRARRRRPARGAAALRRPGLGRRASAHGRRRAGHRRTAAGGGRAVRRRATAVAASSWKCRTTRTAPIWRARAASRSTPTTTVYRLVGAVQDPGPGDARRASAPPRGRTAVVQSVRRRRAADRAVGRGADLRRVVGAPPRAQEVVADADRRPPSVRLGGWRNALLAGSKWFTVRRASTSTS